MQKINPFVFIDWEKLVNNQQKLDLLVHEKKQLPQYSTFSSRKLALIVEVYEFINETKIFKFWSSSTSSREKILFEFVDILHFTLSLSIDYSMLNIKMVKYKNNCEPKSPEFLLDFFLELSGKITTLITAENFNDWIVQLFQIANYFGFNGDEIEKAYFEKAKINEERLKNNY